MKFVMIHNQIVNTDQIIRIEHLSLNHCRVHLRDSHSITTHSLSLDEVMAIIAPESIV
jgi:hypothetical protein